MYLLTIAWMVFEDINLIKNPYDKKNKKFNFKKDWWMKRWDNLIPRAIAGTIGAISAAFGGSYLMAEMFEFHYVLEGGAEVIGVSIFTLLGDRMIKKVLKK